MTNPLISCDRCAYCGDKLYDADPELDLEAAYLCDWPKPDVLPPSLRYADRMRESVKPSDALWCQWYRATNPPKETT